MIFSLESMGLREVEVVREEDEREEEMDVIVSRSIIGRALSFVVVDLGGAIDDGAVFK